MRIMNFFPLFFFILEFSNKDVNSYTVEKVYIINYITLVYLISSIFGGKKRKEKINLFPDMTDGSLGTTF